MKNNKTAFGNKIPEKAITGISFYQGIKLAADTLNKMGYKIDLFVHDITDPLYTPDNLIKNHLLDSSDLIIGAVQGAQIAPIAQFAKEHAINFISALSPSDAGIKENQYFTLLQPSLETHCRFIAGYLLKKHKGGNITLLYRNRQSVNKTAAGSFWSIDSTRFTRLRCDTFPTARQLAPLLDSTEDNILAIPVIESSFADSILQSLYKWFPDYHFEVYGLPSWKNMSSLKNPEAYPNCGINITSPFFFDYTTAAGQNLTENCNKEFGVRANELVFRGYEILYWYSYLLRKYGTIFNNKTDDNGMAPFTHFEIRQKRDRTQLLLYNENQHLYLYRYQGGSYMLQQ